MLNSGGPEHRPESGWHRKVFASAATASSIHGWLTRTAPSLGLNPSGAARHGDRHDQPPANYRRVKWTGVPPSVRSGMGLTRLSFEYSALRQQHHCAGSVIGSSRAPKSMIENGGCWGRLPTLVANQ